MTPEPGPPGTIESYSYQGQDLFVLEALGGLRGGFFLDSGASNGVKGSNTKLLESSFGWTGICVEPNDDLYEQLRRSRTCVCLNCCLYDREGEVEFFETASVYGGILGEYDPGFLRFVKETVGLDPTKDVVPTARKQAHTVGSILRRYHAPPIIDYWSLDTEGSELAILRDFPYDEYVVRVLTVEHNYFSDREPIRALLEAHGYARVWSLGIDDCYVWHGETPDQAWRSAVWSRGRRGRG